MPLMASRLCGRPARVCLFVGVNTGEVQARVGKIMTRDASSFGFALRISTSSVLPSLADLAFGICLDYRTLAVAVALPGAPKIDIAIPVFSYGAISIISRGKTTDAAAHDGATVSSGPRHEDTPHRQRFSRTTTGPKRKTLTVIVPVIAAVHAQRASIRRCPPCACDSVGNLMG